MFDIVISCVYISYALQPWIAIIVRPSAILSDSIVLPLCELLLFAVGYQG